MHGYSAPDVLSEELLRDEEIIWAGQPDRSVHFTSADLYLVPFSLLWGGFAVVWEIIALVVVISGDTSGVALIFPLWGMPFVLMGIYLIAGRFAYKNWKKTRTHYALTPKRALAITLARGKSVRAAFLDGLPTINKTVGRDGVGTVTFGNPSWMTQVENTGLDFFGAFGPVTGIDPAVSFYDIPDADRVYELANDLRRRGSDAHR